MTPELPEVILNLYTPKSPATIKVVENRIATVESSPNIVRHITFDISGTEMVGKVRAGQAIGVVPPGEDEQGKPHKIRLYSVSSATGGEGGQPHLVSTTVKRNIEEVEGKLYTGVCSNYLSNLQPGEELLATGPSGKRFVLPVDAKKWNYLFFATGTGIAPFRGMLKDLFDQGDYNGDACLLFGSPYRTDLLYLDELTELEKKADNFHYMKAISREDRRSDGSKPYVQSLLEDQADLLRPILEKPNTLIYICGLKGMESSIYKKLLKEGFFDYFELREALPADLSALDGAELKKVAKPNTRIFEEVY